MQGIGVSKMESFLKGFVMARLLGKLTVVGAMLSFVSVTSYAADLPLSDVPMAVNSATEPNIMLMFDTSGSMTNIVPEKTDGSSYQEDLDYSCPGLNVDLVPSGTGFWTQVLSGATNAQFYYNSGWKDWGTASGEYCFVKDGLYPGYLQDYTSVYLRVSGGASFSAYTGNYLNWYFSNGAANARITVAADDFDSDTGRKRGTRNRLEIAKSAMTKYIEDLSGVRLGLTSFAFLDLAVTTELNSNKGKIQLGLKSLDDDHKDDAQSIISNLPIDGHTPLASTFANIGRYFIEGRVPLAYDPEIHDVDLASMFGVEPMYGSSATPKPTRASPAIEHSCQKSFLLALTDGEPWGDNMYAMSEFAAYGDENAEPWVRVTQALHEVDLRPDLGEEKNNITTHVIGFGETFATGNTLAGEVADAGGGSFLTAINENKLIEVLNEATASILDQVGSSTSLAFSSSTLKTGSAVFQAKFNSASWSGQLLSLPIDEDGVIGNSQWDAAEKLGDVSNIETGRVIITHDGSDGQAFTWGNIEGDSPGRADDLNLGDADGEDRLAYIRGDQTYETGDNKKYRPRASRLGDIVNSTPVYVGAPELNWPDTDGFGTEENRYSSFKNKPAVMNRTPVVYVGANDGMLHGFNATAGDDDGGKELLSYIPGQVYSSERYDGLHALTAGGYGHQFYVDLTPTVSDVFVISSPGAERDWKSILVGGLRKGGKGYFALDVTNPVDFQESNAENIVLWEFDESDDESGDLGYSYSRPVVAKMSNGEWAVIFGNGYNSLEGKAVLYILFIEKGVDGEWTAATDYIKIDTGEGAVSGNTPNGLSSPAVVDLNFDGVADRIYAGDLNGNMWAFDVSGDDSVWSSPSSRTLVFNSDQPITVEPTVALNPKVATVAGNAPNTLILFGTGSYLTNEDITDEDPGSFYGVWDHGVGNLGKSELVMRTLGTRIPEGGTVAKRVVSGEPIDWVTKSGWYMDLAGGVTADNSGGERVVSEALLRRSILFFNTLIPVAEQCSAGGEGWLMSVDFSTGLAPEKAVFDANDDGHITHADISFIGEKVEGGLLSRPNVVYGKKGPIRISSKGDVPLVDDIELPNSGRDGSLGWQEITPR